MFPRMDSSPLFQLEWDGLPFLACSHPHALEWPSNAIDTLGRASAPLLALGRCT